jgi:hypothetical protein
MNVIVLFSLPLRSVPTDQVRICPLTEGVIGDEEPETYVSVDG